MEHGLEVTFLDASEKLCELADIYTDVEPLCMDYRDMQFTEVFEGIWACASLLHIGKRDLPEMLAKVAAALKPSGVFYMSVKKGDFEGFRNERFFADYSSSELERLIEQTKGLNVIEIWESADVRGNLEDEWLNVLARKV
jgi:predicted TPR repeat methyltransferase